MAETVTVFSNSAAGNALQQMLMCEDLEPGAAPSYQTCKTILSYHPLGAKMTTSPIKMAQSQKRKITVAKGPEDRLVKAFLAEHKRLGMDRHIRNMATQARAYGIASIALLVDGVPVSQAVDYEKLHGQTIAFNVLDPLNTAGSLVLNQDPNAMDFQKIAGISVAGVPYHRSRTVSLMNEEPIYIQYTSSAFGYVGRSVFQRPLFPLKTYIQTLITDDLIVVKSGVLVAKMKQPGSIIDGITQQLFGMKRQLVKEAATGNVLGISIEEEIETLNMQNLEAPYSLARKNCLENIATGSDMPAVILNQETFAEGFGEGTEDSKKVAQFVNDVREWLDPAYVWGDEITMYRAWNPDFYKTIQKDFPKEYGSVSYREAFYDWKNSFEALWPSFLEEPDSEKVKVEDVKLKAVIALIEVLVPNLDPENRAELIEWACECFNEQKLMFPDKLQLDFDALREYEPPVPAQMPGEPKPFAAQDSVGGPRLERAKAQLVDAVGRLPDHTKRRIVEAA